jgi:hypothetical protein
MRISIEERSFAVAIAPIGALQRLLGVCFVIGLGLGAVSLQAGAQAQERDEVARPSTRQRYWLGEDGAPLPFRNDDEIEEFLRTAEVVELEPIGIGVTNPERVTLEKNGVRAHAVFRCFDRHWSRVRLRGQGMMMNFRDSYRFEAAAYELAGLLGLDSVPPTVTRRVGNRNGCGCTRR